MMIFINGVKTQIKNDVNLEKILKANFSDSYSYAVAVNNEFVPKSKYKNTIIVKGDIIEVVSAHPGG
jgi:thiamine biosynthesis protein ThiS